MWSLDDAKPWSSIEMEFFNHQIEDPFLATRVFRSIADPKVIDKFISQSSLYDSVALRWRKIPQSKDLAASEGLYAPLLEIMTDVISHFGLATERIARDMRSSAFGNWVGGSSAIEYPEPYNLHDGKVDPRSEWYPSICIEGGIVDRRTRSNFKYSTEMRNNFTRTVSPFKILEHSQVDHPSSFQCLALWTRQIFLQQANRHMVNCFLVTNNHIRLYTFSRDGVHYSKTVDIHKYPSLFVKFILGAASVIPEIAGYDSSIYWEDGSRYIATLDSSTGKTLTCKIAFGGLPYMLRTNIRRRATACWIAYHDEVPYLVKDAWKSPEKAAEAEMLKDVVGLEGVVQMVSHQDNITTTSKLRNLDAAKFKADYPRTFEEWGLNRVVLKCYNHSIARFLNRKHFIDSFYGALLGHRNLWQKGILHRDISADNILTDSTRPYWGVLIDLDLSVRLDAKRPLELSNPQIGTRQFQSINVLTTYNPTPRTYLDDLESFLYVLCSICSTYTGPGARVAPIPEILEKWKSADPCTSEVWKRMCFERKSAAASRKTLRATPYFGAAIQTLMDQMWAFFDEVYFTKEEVIVPTTTEEVLRITKAMSGRENVMLRDIMPESNVVYGRIIGYVSQARDKIHAEGEVDSSNI